MRGVNQDPDEVTSYRRLKAALDYDIAVVGRARPGELDDAVTLLKGGASHESAILANLWNDEANPPSQCLVPCAQPAG